jgi:hypothetical protein
MSGFLKEWQPIVKDVNERDLNLITEYGGCKTITQAHMSEGDTVYIVQHKTQGFESPEYISLDRHQLYNLIFNFMSGTELVKLAEKKLEFEFKKIK